MYRFCLAAALLTVFPASAAQAPSAQTVALHPPAPAPAPAPAKVGDTEDFPFLTPLPGMKLLGTERDTAPMDYWVGTGQGNDYRHFAPGGGNVTKTYGAPESLTPARFVAAYAPALTKAGWTIDYTMEDSIYAHYARNGRDIYASLYRGENIMFAVAEPQPPIHLVLKPPAAKTEIVGDQDDLPYLTRLPGWTLEATYHSKDPLAYIMAGADQPTLVGSDTVLKSYAGQGDLSNDTFERTYENALTKAGWTIDQKDANQGYLYAHYDKNGRDLWAYLNLGEKVVFQVADVGSGLKAALTEGCKVAVYGVNFDFNKATLRPDAEPVLQQMLTLFKDIPTLTVEIGGHTDDVGTPAYNQTLSEQRAASVKTWLVAHGVASSRLTAHGYGQSEPLVPNDSDDNRAKNRRVELKKPNCGGS